METITTVIFDDNKPRRELLEMLINATEGLQCIGAYNDCTDVVEIIGHNIPDIVLMDIDMPYVNGIDGVRLIKQSFPQVIILMQTVFEDDKKIFDAIMAGADGYILKKATPQKLIESIFEAMEGGAPMSPSVAKQVLHLFHSQKPQQQENEFNLTKREQEILTLLVQGYSYRKISEKCFISYPTVNSHISHIYEKLHVKNGIEAVAKAIEKKIV
ncbi:MAG TPA: response regulator transcription factor [Candidatus Kapabacteria bacterium]|jgi:DNA-binding NarL/FixJ family response regulator|nr:response regulator transcription factor [Ignavibacteria bacterium]HRK59588.1 response regulator transcription factor [Candidatus Kapabacteria bacterium]